MHPEQSESALSSVLGDRLDMAPLEAAYGLAEVVDENMANAARVHAVENGEDLSEYTMIAFGGAAPLHRWATLRKTGCGSLPGCQRARASAQPSGSCARLSALKRTGRFS